MDNFETFGTANLGTANLIGRASGYHESSGRKTAFAITPTMSGDVALALAGIDWTVDVEPLCNYMDNQGAETVFLSFRSDNHAIVGVNGKKHHPIQNTVLAEFADTVRTLRPDAMIVQGGSRRGGQTTFLIVEFDDVIDLGGGDTVRRRLLIGTHHNGGRLFIVDINSRMFCSNQWTSFTKGKERIVSISHTASADSQIVFAHRALEASVQRFDEWDHALRELVATPMRANDAFKTIAGDRPTEEGRALTEWENKLDRLWKEYAQDFNSGLVGTAAGILMAAQGVDEHLGKVNRGMRDEQRIGRLITGNYPLAQRAMQLVAV